VFEKKNMMRFAIEKLGRIINAEPQSQTAGEITGVSIDSRTTKPGDCFFAIKGERFDGHDYIDRAFSKGAACAVISANSKNAVEAADSASVLKVADTVKALGDFAGQYRRGVGFKVVAITGSAGKTTTREMIYHVLRRYFACFQAPKSFNNNIGLPLSLLNAGVEHEIVIVELGSNCPGEIAILSRIARPDIAVITNVYPAHLAGFGGIDAIIREKTDISEALTDDGVFIINGDFAELLEYCRQKPSKFLTFGTSDSCDITAENVGTDGFEGRFSIDGIKVSLPVAGRGNIENALAAWAVCKQFGISLKDFAQVLAGFWPVAMRMEPIKFGSVIVLNDCYNANPASMKNALDCLAGVGRAKTGRLVFICGAMMELGDESQMLHAELGRMAGQAGVEVLLACGEFGRITVQAVKEATGHNLQTERFDDTAELCDNIQEFVKPGDIILVKGSRAAKLERVVERLKELFG